MEPGRRLRTYDDGSTDWLERVKGSSAAGAEYRRLMQRLGTEGGRAILGQNLWVDALLRRIEAIEGDVVVTDVRFDNEAAALRDLGAEIWLIQRPGVDVGDGHPSERGISPDRVTRMIGNDGSIEELYARVDRVLRAEQ